MSRLLSAIRLDATVQLRNSLYTIGIGVSLLIALLLWRLAPRDQMWALVPTLMLLVVGGSTLLYVAGMIIFERAEGTLAATIVSPLRVREYLSAKVISLTALATLEAVVMVGVALLLMRLSAPVDLPHVPILLLGVVTIGLIYTLIGIIMVVRYDKITDFLVPMAGVAIILQLPFLYFLSWFESPLLLLIPTSAPSMLMRGAYLDLSSFEWSYALLYSAALVIGLALWAQRSFVRHVVMKAG